MAQAAFATSGDPASFSPTVSNLAAWDNSNRAFKKVSATVSSSGDGFQIGALQVSEIYTPNGAGLVIALDDNQADVFSIYEGATEYLSIDTTDGSELITLAKNVAVGGTLTDGTMTLDGSGGFTGVASIAITGAISGGTSVSATTITDGTFSVSAGAVSGVTTLAMGGGLSGVTTLAMSSYADLTAMADPGAPADGAGRLHVRTVSTVEELFFRSDGGEVQITSGGALNTGELTIESTTSDTFTINSDNGDVTAQLIFGRTTGGTAVIGWDGTDITFDEPLNVTGNITVSGTVDGVDVASLDSSYTAHAASSSEHGVSGSIVGTTDSQTLTNKTLTSPVLTTPQINDTSSDHQYVFAVSELAADRTVTLPLLTGDDTFVFAAFTQTLTNKTLTAPVISSIVNTGTLTLPTSTDTLVGKATTDTFTNKTFDVDGTGNSLTNIADANIKAAAGIDATKIGNGDVTDTELSYLSATTSAVLGKDQTGTISGTLTYSAPLIQTNTTDSSSSTTGAFKTAGGMGIAKKLYVGTDADVGGALTVTGATTLSGALTVGGNLTVNGDTFTTTSQTVVVEDNVIRLNSNSGVPGADLGMVGQRHTDDVTSGAAFYAAAAQNVDPGTGLVLTGTATFTNTSTSVTGSGTSFASELEPNDKIMTAGGTVYTVLSIESDEGLTLASAATSTENGVAFGLAPDGNWLYMNSGANAADDFYKGMVIAPDSGYHGNGGAWRISHYDASLKIARLETALRPNSIVALTGTVAVAGTTAVTGTGTDFTNEVEAGGWIMIDGTAREVASVTDGTNLMLQTAHPDTSSGHTAFFTEEPGQIALVEDSATVTGTNTTFQTSGFAAGDKMVIPIYDGSNFEYVEVIIDSVASETSMTLKAAWTRDAIEASNYLQTQATAFAVNLSGTVSITSSDTALTGSGTQFQTELTVGDVILVSGEYFRIATITSDTAATVSANANATHSAQTAQLVGVGASTNLNVYEKSYAAFLWDETASSWIVAWSSDPASQGAAVIHDKAAFGCGALTADDDSTFSGAITVTGAVNADGGVVSDGDITPANGDETLGTSAAQWGGLHLAATTSINFNNTALSLTEEAHGGDRRLTLNAGNALAFRDGGSYVSSSAANTLDLYAAGDLQLASAEISWRGENATLPAADIFEGVELAPGTLTEHASGTTTRVSTLSVKKGAVTGAGGDITDTATLYIDGALTEGTSGNYALWVDAGKTRLDGNLDMPSAGTILTIGGDFVMTHGTDVMTLSSGDSFQFIDSNAKIGSSSSGVLDVTATTLNLETATITLGATGASAITADAALTLTATGAAMKAIGGTTAELQSAQANACYISTVAVNKDGTTVSDGAVVMWKSGTDQGFELADQSAATGHAFVGVVANGGTVADNATCPVAMEGVVEVLKEAATDTWANGTRLYLKANGTVDNVAGANYEITVGYAAEAATNGPATCLVRLVREPMVIP